MLMMTKTHGQIIKVVETELMGRIENLENRLAGAIGRNLVAQKTIADMQPDYQRGVARRLACEKENAKRKAARAGK
jgi:hypothetical protein